MMGTTSGHCASSLEPSNLNPEGWGAAIVKLNMVL